MAILNWRYMYPVGQIKMAVHAVRVLTIKCVNCRFCSYSQYQVQYFLYLLACIHLNLIKTPRCSHVVSYCIYCTGQVWYMAGCKYHIQ